MILFSKKIYKRKKTCSVGFLITSLKFRIYNQKVELLNRNAKS